MSSPEYVVVFCTAPEADAKAIADSLIDARLAACVNIAPVASCFRWEGEVCNEPEHLLVIKTRTSRLDPLIERVREVHPYDLPEIIALPIVGGFAPYLDWIGEETG
ncbi:divalent-cation tolerance protein CutA [Methanoculleus sp. FWC-SCC1]|uniref:Divalent-cation tolerance protein CutA n=1 Tax=Methanoculleus frigidifontis TaxID=2584085 RepID=A0ABT8MC99_9EURY|nr:divalent-cation tolerance protein CutA [Methanoculleus sp. FWC-SCC1]MDN7025566.1 divalent-cation tolerance protein CutA [Methanoculleus sp. FWC-SCC1]